MEKGQFPGAEAVKVNGWFKANRFLLLRRVSQVSLLALFLAGPWLGYWIVKGNMASSLTLDVLPLTDPLVFLQAILTGNPPVQAGIIGAAVVFIFYFLVGGRVYCSWVCPINIITDTANWLRRKLKLKGGTTFSRQSRYWLLLAILILALLTGNIVWELVNPVSMVYRGLIFGMGMAWGIVIAIFLLDLLVAHNAWCGHLCPVGAFYSLIGKFSVLRISAVNRQACDDCLDCFAVCPESRVIKPALKGADQKIGPVILSGQCNNCARCIDVCAKDVFSFSTRFSNQLPESKESSNQREVMS
ncbi:MAG: quinol dehydrogenase ferredoxin subunit NapH [Gammaproteobacteria bacterium]|nr:quinol dehydrogenase ferredoxin subunit NapH [Gammaproteobacteria bacterium]NNJ92558.1 quinol dehydrogenase ferredoxin subunit NapH [Gammaproteobacteria bacterium]